MATIERVEILQVDLPPKVVRTDAIQSFVTQETPIVRITCDDGARGRRLHVHDRHRRLVGGRAAARPPRAAAHRPRRRRRSRRSGRTSSSTRTRPPSARSRASRSRRSTRRCGTCGAGAPGCRCGRWRAARSAQVPVYTTEGGWLHHSRAAAGRRGASPRRRRASGARRSRSASRRSPRTSRGSPRCARRSATRSRSWSTPTRRSPWPRRCRRAHAYEPFGARLVRGAAAGRGPGRPRRARRQGDDADRGRRIALSPGAFPRVPRTRRLLDRPGRLRAHRRHHAVAQGRASRRDVQRRRSARIS